MWRSRDRVTTFIKMEGAIKMEYRREHETAVRDITQVLVMSQNTQT